jgi:CheY-like chemotaxis protein
LEGVPFRDHSQPGPTQHVRPTAPSARANLECRILLAEDGPDNQRLISLLLKKAGVEVTVAQNGREAVDKVLAAMTGAEHGQQDAARPFDLVLMDIQMPVMDGYEATRVLRRDGYRGPIIALTAHAMPQDVRHCLEAGCDFHLSKPIERDTLLNTVARFLEPSPVAACGEPEGSSSQGQSTSLTHLPQA